VSLLDRVRTDFVNLVLNTDDFAETVSYTPAGGTAVEITALVIPEESRQEDRNGFFVQIDQIHVSAPNATWTPNHGARVVWDSRTWDFARREHDRGGGFVGAYFESFSILHAGSAGSSPV
jgi:hypothetical protein